MKWIGVLAGAALVLALLAPPASAGVVVEHCDHVAEGNFDPILYPGVDGASHLHEFYGNPTIDPSSTAADLVGGPSTCDLNDSSAFWLPAVYVDGQQIDVPHVGPYWKDNGGDVVAPPAGTELIGGHDWGNAAYFQCTPGGHYLTPPDCTGRGVVKITVNFPSCWDGQGNDQTDFAYPNTPARSDCPAGFDEQIPMLNLHIVTRIVDGSGSTWELALLADGTTGSYETAHADWIDGFDPGAMTDLVDSLNR